MDFLYSQGLWSRFFPSYTKLKQELEAGAIGDPLYVAASFCYDMQHVPRSVENKLGGGALYDLAIYCVQLATWVFPGYPERICSSAIMENGNSCMHPSICSILN